MLQNIIFVWQNINKIKQRNFNLTQIRIGRLLHVFFCVRQDVVVYKSSILKNRGGDPPGQNQFILSNYLTKRSDMPSVLFKLDAHERTRLPRFSCV